MFFKLDIYHIQLRRKIEPRWTRQAATLMVNHSITKEAMQCESCHTSQEKGVMSFEELGYAEERIKDLLNLIPPVSIESVEGGSLSIPFLNSNISSGQFKEALHQYSLRQKWQ